jgi:hypothetical protein
MQDDARFDEDEEAGAESDDEEEQEDEATWAAEETDDVGATELADALAWLGEHENLRDLRALVVQRESWVSAKNRAKGVLLHLVQMLKASNPPMSKALSRCRSAMIPVLCSAQEQPAPPRDGDIDPPLEFVCPISQAIFTDPVVASDGFTYDRSQIETWLGAHHGTSPMTNAPLKSRRLTPNHNLRSQISTWTDGVTAAAASKEAALQAEALRIEARALETHTPELIQVFVQVGQTDMRYITVDIEQTKTILTLKNEVARRLAAEIEGDHPTTSALSLQLRFGARTMQDLTTLVIMLIPLLLSTSEHYFTTQI